MSDVIEDFVKTLGEYEEFANPNTQKKLENIGKFLLNKNLKMYEVKYVLLSVYNIALEEFERYK